MQGLATMISVVVGTIPAGFPDPDAARSAITPVASSATLDVLIARNRIIALLAVPLTGFSLSNCLHSADAERGCRVSKT